MDWMEVMPEHPNNPYSVAHQSGEGQVEFIGCRNVNIRVEGQADELEKVIIVCPMWLLIVIVVVIAGLIFWIFSKTKRRK